MPRAATWLATMRRRLRRVLGAGTPKHRTPRLLSHRVNYTLTATNLRRAPLSQPFQPRILIVGDRAARPEGLERFLVRGGFHVTEAAYPVPGADRAEAQPPDLLIFASGGRRARLGCAVRDLATSSRFAGAPLIVLLADGGAEAMRDALQAGAQDALAGPVHFGELRARIDAGLRLRGELYEARDALRSRDMLFDIFQEVSAALRADEIFQILVRRVGRVFGLAHCSFMLTTPGDERGRVVAVYENPGIRDLGVDLERYPEIQEEIRTECAVVIQDVHEQTLFESVGKPGRPGPPTARRVRARAALLAPIRSGRDRRRPAARDQRGARAGGRRPRARRDRRPAATRDPRARLRGSLRRRRVRADPPRDRCPRRSAVRPAAARDSRPPYLPGSRTRAGQQPVP